MFKRASVILAEMCLEKIASKMKIDPIVCEQCGYEGMPTRQGLCPECMAICGKMPQPPYKKPEPEYENEPVNGNTVEDQYIKDTTEINGRMV